MGNCLGRCLSSGKNSFSLRWSTDEQESDELVPENEISDEKYIFKIMKFKKKKRRQFIDKFAQRQDKNYARLNKAGLEVKSSEIQLQCLDAKNLIVSTTSIHKDHTPLPITQFDSNQQQMIGQQIGIASSSRASSSLDLEWEHEYATALSANKSEMAREQQQSWYFLSDEFLSTSSAQKQILNINYNDITEKQKYNFDSINNLNGGQQNNVLFHPKNPDIIQLQQQINNDNGNQKIIFVRTPSRTSWSHISTPESLEWDIDEEQQKKLVVEDDNLDHETLELLHNIEMLKNIVLNETGDGLEIQYKNS